MGSNTHGTELAAIGNVVSVTDKNRLVEGLAAKQQSRLRRFLRTRVRNAADVQDIIQEVYLRLLRVPNHETIRVPERYIFTIARHVAQQHRLQNAPTDAAIQIEEALPELVSGNEVDPLLEVTAEQCLVELDAALRDMTPKVQATFLLSRRDGMSVDEIGTRLGISRHMAKKYLVKSLVQIRKRFKDGE
jgi:RNA polymerase sigma factor (sigma-70 family)